MAACTMKQPDASKSPEITIRLRWSQTAKSHEPVLTCEDYSDPYRLLMSLSQNSGIR